MLVTWLQYPFETLQGLSESEYVLSYLKGGMVAAILSQANEDTIFGKLWKNVRNDQLCKLSFTMRNFRMSHWTKTALQNMRVIPAPPRLISCQCRAELQLSGSCHRAMLFTFLLTKTAKWSFCPKDSCLCPCHLLTQRILLLQSSLITSSGNCKRLGSKPGSRRSTHPCLLNAGIV